MFLEFKNLKIKNFLSYKDAFIDLSNKGYCFVSGKNNYKEDNALSNGSGKSTFLQAICWCLTGETISGIKTDLKNLYVDEKETYVELNVLIDGKYYKLIRYYEPKSDLKIYVDGEDKSGKGIRESEKILSELLPDLNKDLISNVIVLGQGLPNKFSSHSPVGRKELLEKLSRSDFMIEDIKNRINNREDILNKEKRRLEDNILELKTKSNLLNTQITEIKNDLNSFVNIDYEKEISRITIELEILKTKITNLNTEIEEKQLTLKTIDIKLNKANAEKQKDLNEELEAYNQAIQTIIAALSSKKSNLIQIENEIRKLESIRDICPTCGQKLPGVIKPDTTNQKIEASKLKTEIEELTKKDNSIKTKHNSFINEINNTYKTEILNNQIEKENIEKVLKIKLAEKENLEKQIFSLSSDLNKINYKKENDSKIILEKQNKLTTYTETIDKLNKNQEKESSALIEIDNRLTIIKKINTFVKRDFRGYLLRDVIDYLNHKIKEYSLFIFDHDNIEMILEGTNLNIYFNNKLCEALSGGERQKIDLLVQLTIRDMLVTYMDFHSSILCLDEITDNLDEIGCSKIFDLLSSKLEDLESIFIISHHDKELNIPIDTELLVTKGVDGISRISETI